MGKTIGNNVRKENWRHGDSLIQITLHISEYQLNQLRKLKEKRFIPSISEGMRIIFYLGYPYLLDEIEKGARLLSTQYDRISTNSTHTPPDVVFIYTGKGKYKKYKEVK